MHKDIKTGPIEVRDNKDLVLKVVSTKDLALKYVSQKIRSDQDVIFLTVRRNRAVLRFIPEHFKNEFGEDLRSAKKLWTGALALTKK